MLSETVVIEGEVSLVSQIDGDPSLLSAVDGDPDVVIAEGMSPTYPHYSGSYTVTPSSSVQTLDTSDKIMDDDVTVQAVPQGSATTPATIITADPTISVSSGGLITAQVSKTQQITPTVVEGYVETGTPGNVGVAGSNTEQLSVQGAQTIHPASTDQSIASGKYLTGAQTFKAVTVSGLTADKVLQGNVVKIGDADDDDRIMSVTGTASGGITPTGTKSITANGTGIDVYSYQYADVAVPNSYSSSDEGKVVSNGALVSQTSDTVTENDTYDTTLINSLTVNVSGGGFDWNRIAQNLDPYGDAVITSGTKIADYAFSRKPVTSVYSDTSGVATKLGSSCFAYCSSLTKVILKYCTQSENNSTGYQFQGARMNYIALPRYSAQFNTNAAQGSYVQIADIGSATAIAAKAFSGSSSFNTLILRRSDGLTSLANTNGIAENTVFKNGGTGGTIYIPKVLYDHLGDGTALDYQSATNWATIYGYGTITWAVLEGSAYESMDWADNL